jgi:hypothetical protein
MTPADPLDGLLPPAPPGRDLPRHDQHRRELLRSTPAPGSGRWPSACRPERRTGVAASTQEGSVRVSVPRAAASSHVIQATTGTGTVTVTGS